MSFSKLKNTHFLEFYWKKYYILTQSKPMVKLHTLIINPPARGIKNRKY